nr:hypothetical protein [Tanacetum cinerariifolium]
MALTFAENHNMITHLTKSDASEGVEQILDFLNARGCIQTGGIIADLDADKDVILEEVDAEVDTANAAIRRKGVVIRDPEETATPSTIVHSDPKAKDKGKGILVEEPKPLKKQAQIEQDEAYARELVDKLNRNINWDDVIEQYFNSNVAFLEKSKEQLEEEESRALKRQSESSEQQAAKKQKLDQKIVKDRFSSSKPKNFSDDFLLTTLKAIFEKPDVEAQSYIVEHLIQSESCQWISSLYQQDHLSGCKGYDVNST